VLRELVDRVASPRVGICLDTANSLGAGERESVQRSVATLEKWCSLL